MSLTDLEILELEQLLKEQELDLLKEGLYSFDEKTNPNYISLYKAIKEQEYNKKGELINGYSGFVLEGSSRSGKTWSSVDIILWLCLYVETNCTINIYRETYTEFKETLYEDFKRRLEDFELDNPFKRAKEIKSFKIRDNKIAFLGCDKLGKSHGAGADYVFYNEMMHIPKDVFNQSKMRCRKFWWGDYNPSYTDHWVFNTVIPRPDIGFLRTTFLDNPYISTKERNEILAYAPWLPNSYEIREEDIYYQNEPITQSNQPPPHPTNIENGTSDEFMWKVYGLGLRGAMKGVIFEHLTYIDKFPDIAYTYANDFGFTADPNALVKYAEDENNIWFEVLSYDPIETVEELDEYYKAVGVEKDLPIICDSSDKYTGENKGTVEMVKGLKRKGWLVSKVSKTKSVMYWILSMKKKKLHCVKNQFWKYAKRERENYKFKEIQGILINQPIDQYNHIWDAVRYGHISHNSKTEIEETKESLSDMGINY